MAEEIKESPDEAEKATEAPVEGRAIPEQQIVEDVEPLVAKEELREPVEIKPPVRRRRRKKKKKKEKKLLKLVQDNAREYVSKLPTQRAKRINRADYDETNLQGYILQERIRDIERIEMCREMEVDKSGYYLTSYVITIKEK